MLPVKNWAGNLAFNPCQVIAPKSLEEICAFVKASNKSIRTRGSTHSWTELIVSKENYLHLDQLQGIIDSDLASRRVKVWGGTKLKRLGEELFALGLGLENQGDVDHQSIAGACSTGTHGTGIGLRSISNQIRSLSLVTSSGEVLSVKEDDPTLKAAALSLGVLGIISDITLQTVPAYKLKVSTFPEMMEEAIQKFDERIKAHRHLEMFYFPMGDWTVVKTMDETPEKISQSNLKTQLHENILEDWLFGVINEIAFKTKAYGSIDKLMKKFVSRHTKIDWSHLAFPAQRNVKFMEMEYNLPFEKFEEAFDEIRSVIKMKKIKTLFPIEIRFVKGDDLWLSPAYCRDSVYFAIHSYIKEDYRDFFKSIESIFKKYQGRPHWGKWHSLTSKDLSMLYPKWDEFQKVRKALDPRGKWTSPYVSQILGE